MATHVSDTTGDMRSDSDDSDKDGRRVEGEGKVVQLIAKLFN